MIFILDWIVLEIFSESSAVAAELVSSYDGIVVPENFYSLHLELMGLLLSSG